MQEHMSSKKEESRYTSGTYVPEYSVTKYRYRKDVTSLVALGRKAFTDGEYEAALRYFKAILLIDPANKLAMYFKKKTIYKMRMLELGRQRESESLQAEESVDPEAHSLVKCTSCGGSGICTRCNPHLFFSYRAARQTGRFAALIGLDMDS